MAKETDPVKVAEKRGYAKGYAAGKARKYRAITSEQAQRRKDAQWNRAFLAALPACIESNGWEETAKDGSKKPITDLKARTRLAADFADESMKYLRTFHD